MIDLAAWRIVKRHVERDLRQRYPLELAMMPEGAVEAYLADEAARYALAFTRLAWPEGDPDPAPAVS